jgi:hypothetical protein
MSVRTRDATAVGILFIVASVTAIIGGSLAALPLDDADYLLGLAGQDTQVISGVLLLVVQTVAVVGIAVLLYPVLSREHAGLALGYIAARTIEGVLVLVGALSVLALVTLSRDQAEAAGATPLGDVLVATYDWSYLLGPMLFFSVSALILYPMLLRARLVPAWLSVWGLAGGLLLLARTVAEMYGADLPALAQGLIAAPIGINEMVLALWLIIKGFTLAPEQDAAPALIEHSQT